MTEMRRPARRRLAIGYALVIAILLLNAIVTYANLRALLGNWYAVTLPMTSSSAWMASSPT